MHTNKLTISLYTHHIHIYLCIYTRWSALHTYVCDVCQTQCQTSDSNLTNSKTDFILNLDIENQKLSHITGNSVAVT